MVENVVHKSISRYVHSELIAALTIRVYVHLVTMCQRALYPYKAFNESSRRREHPYLPHCHDIKELSLTILVVVYRILQSEGIVDIVLAPAPLSSKMKTSLHLQGGIIAPQILPERSRLALPVAELRRAAQETSWRFSKISISNFLFPSG